jgi:hypothetical protein
MIAASSVTQVGKVKMRKWIPVLFVMSVLSYTSSAVSVAKSKLNIVLDTSGSMAPFTENIATSILKIKQHNYTSQGLNKDLTNHIGLYSFTEQAELVLKGDSDDVFSFINTVKTNGGTEDGLIAIERILLDPSVFNAQIVLFTDEGRDLVKDVDLAHLISQANKKNITIHSVLNRSIFCQAKHILGINNLSEGYSIDGEFHKCNDRADIASLNGKRDTDDYVKLSLSTGGLVWNIRKLFKNSQGKFDTERAIDSFALYIANELNNSSDLTYYADVVTSGDLTLGNIITINASNVVGLEEVVAVELWEWDLNNDGTIDDYGPVINFEPKNQGSEQISLWMSRQIDNELVREKQEIRLKIK